MQLSSAEQASQTEKVVANGVQALDRADLRVRARRSLSATPRPFLRWAGSKRALLPHLIDVLPSSFLRYYEPFAGGASMFFLLRPHRAQLSDSCGELIDTFCAVRDAPEAVLKRVLRWKPDKDFYYEMRANRSTDPIERAAEFIYLNKCCWNGLYRVNGDGMFNVPYGAPKTEFIIDPDNLRACAAALQASGVGLLRSEFTPALEEVTEGDLVFLDPPYVTQHNNNGFIDYNETLFSWSDQVGAADLAADLADRGASVIVTNALHDDVVALYPTFSVKPVDRASTIASSSTKRGRMQEAIFWRRPA